jgi:imidazoleglycerol-phosphate dehydratase / histidinol-phosphatase
MKKVLFIDRDGTLIEEPADEQIDSLEKLTFIPGAITSLSKIAKELDYELVMVTNQDGLGTDSFPEDTFWPAQNKMIKTFEGEGIHFSEVFIDKTLAREKAPTRKPGTALLTRYLATGINPDESFVIGDRLTDVEFAGNLGCRAILFGTRFSEKAALVTDDWNEIYRFLKYIPRRAKVERKTSETSISVEINLDGTGKSNIRTGIGFFDHLLEQLPKHGLIDLTIEVQGDLEVDEHHTIEDTALALGGAFSEALGKKKGINRYGFTLPMDDSLATVAIDLGGRAWLTWDAEFRREKIGEMPSEMFFHFFRSFSDAARCNISVKSEGENEHHMIESIFKAFAKAIGMAVKGTGNYSIPSSKGTI